jgi:predicted nucleic acid-binding protein
LLPRKLVVDTNVIVAWLLKPSGLSARIIRSLALDLHTPYKSTEEIWNHRSEWSQRSPGFSTARFIELMRRYMRVEFVERNSWYDEAARIMSAIDPSDTEFFALALKLDAPIWTHDPDFKKQTRVPILTNSDILRQSASLPELWEALRDV